MIIGAYILSITLMIITPVVLAVWLRRRVRTPWFLFSIGMLTFAVSQLVHFPLNGWLADLGVLPGTGVDTSLPLWRTALILGLTAGICEELARAAGYALLRGYRNKASGLMLGLGHGGIESMVFGGVLTAATLSSLLPLAGTDLSSLNLTPDQLAAVQMQMDMALSSPWQAFLPLLERLLAMSIHVVFSLIVLQAFLKRQPLYLGLAVLYHALLDASLVYVLGITESALVSFITLVAACVPGWIWGFLFLKKQPGLSQEHHPGNIQDDLRTFVLSVRKELLQQWRTRRVLAVFAVFGVFGLTSPLLAYFTPEMMKAIPGAEQFAGLIPEPTQVDAFTQYIKNISQFGFLLAILIGIGDVAGEKERGTASMILSKPLPRWAFITSKYTAQIIVFIGGCLIAWIGSAFYTIILFEPPDAALVLGQFGVVSLLLLAWLLTYLTVGLIGSTLASSVTTAAGLSFVGALVLMFTGYIPQISSLLPAALLGWASQVASSPDLPPFNGGALAVAAILSLVGVVTSVALFEQQEL